MWYMSDRKVRIAGIWQLWQFYCSDCADRQSYGDSVLEFLWSTSWSALWSTMTVPRRDSYLKHDKMPRKAQRFAYFMFIMVNGCIDHRQCSVAVFRLSTIAPKYRLPYLAVWCNISYSIVIWTLIKAIHPRSVCLRLAFRPLPSASTFKGLPQPVEKKCVTICVLTQTHNYENLNQSMPSLPPLSDDTDVLRGFWPLVQAVSKELCVAWKG